MSKSRKSKRGDIHRRESKSRDSSGPFFARDPLRNLDADQRDALAKSLAKESRLRFDKNLSDLTEIAGCISPLHILSMLACYSLMAPVREAAHAGNRPLSGTRVQQGQVELFQALLLKNVPKCFTPPEPDLSQRVFDGLPNLFEAHGFMQMPLDIEEVSQEQAAVHLVQSYLRNHTASVRNWGYFSAMVRISTELFSALDRDFEKEYRITLTQSIALFEHLIRRLEELISEKYLRRMQVIYQAKTPAGMAKAVGENFKEFEGVEELQDILSHPGMSERDARQAVFMAAESILPTLFIFESDVVADELALNPSSVRNLLDCLSLSFGALSEATPEKIILENPVWTRPLIKLGEGVYFCAMPQVLMSFVFSIVEELIAPYPAWQSKLQKRRAMYLEDQAERLMREAFPGCEIVRGYKWKEEGRQYESDLALRYDSTIFLVESKSGRVSWPALRGRPDRIVRDIHELIVRPSDQSARLAQRLQEAISGVTGSPVHDFPLRIDNVRSIVRLSVMLQDFATIQSVPSLMAEAGLVRTEYRLAPCLTLSDLEVVIDLLDSPYLRLHYLRRRAELLSSMRLIGDELDMLGFYLDTGLNVGEAEIGSHQLVAIGYSSHVDNYYIAESEGLNATKPKPKVSSWIQSLCDQAFARQTPGWSEIVFHLLCLPVQAQRDIKTELRMRQKKIASGKIPEDGHNAIVFVPDRHRRVALVFYVRLPGGETTREYAERFASITFNEEHVELCLVVGFAADPSNLLYNSTALMYRTDRSIQINTYL
jgi:hypothetical protein